MLADQKAQILSGLVLVVLTLLGTRLIYMKTDRFLVSMEPVTAILLLLFFSSEIVAITLGILVVMPTLPKSKMGMKVLMLLVIHFSLERLLITKRMNTWIIMQKILFVMIQQGVFLQQICIRVVKFYPLNIVN